MHKTVYYNKYNSNVMQGCIACCTLLKVEIGGSSTRTCTQVPGSVHPKYRLKLCFFFKKITITVLNYSYGT